MRWLIPLVLLLVLASCSSGGNQSSVPPSLELERASVSFQSSDRSDWQGVNRPAAQSLDEAFAELDALQAPEGVNEALFAELKAALRKALNDPRNMKDGYSSSVRVASSPPTGDANKPFDLTLVDMGEDEYILAWHEVNAGDFDNNGAVGIADITPLAMHYGKFVTDRNSEVGLVDASGDYVANIADITGIAINFGNELAGYNIYVEGFADPMPNRDGLGELSVMRAEKAGDERVAYSYELTLGVLLDVTVVPVDASGEEGIVSDPAVVSTGEPAPPQDLTATAGETIGVGRIELLWTANAEPDMLEYRIFRRAGAGEFEQIAYVPVMAEPSFSDDDRGDYLEPGVLYTYYAVAVNTVGTASVPSTEAGATPFYPELSAPPWHEAMGAEEGIEVTWGAVEDTTYLGGYEVWRRGPGEGEFSLLQAVGPDVTGIVDSDGLVPGESYDYKVRAFDDYGRYSDFTDVASAAYSPSGELAIVSLTTDRTTLQVNSDERAHLTVEVTDPTADISWEATDGSFTDGDTGTEVTYAPPDSGGAQQVTVTVTAERGTDVVDENTQLIVTTLEDLGAAVDFAAPSFSTPAEPYRAFAYYLNQEKVIMLDFGAIG